MIFIDKEKYRGRIVSVIYCITNKINGKFYIGSTYNVNQRYQQYKTQLGDKSYGNKHLVRAYHKYGANNFTFEILEHCPVEDLEQREQDWIDEILLAKNDLCYFYASGYNKRPIVDSNRGKINSEYHNKNISKNHARYWLGRKRPQWLNDLMSDKFSGENNPFYGKTHTEETRKILSEKLTGENHPNWGKNLKESTKAKIAKKHCKKVIQIDKETNKEIAVFNSAMEAIEITGIKSIYRYLTNKKGEVHSKYIFKYLT